MQAQSPPFNPSFVRIQHEARASAAAEYAWGWAELFIALQLLWGLALFVPGAQAYRVYIRALPYVISGASLVYYFRRQTGEPLPVCSKWLAACLAVMLLNLVWPTAHLTAGVGQIIFQASIVAPVFWMARAIRNERRLVRLVWVLFAASVIASAVGVLQVYFPARFLPPEFSALAQTLNPDIISALTYAGADGRAIVRPPGLSDMPGGAAVAGMMTVVIGLTLAIKQGQSSLVRVVCLSAAAVGMTVLFLTHVRSLSLLAAASVGVCVALRFRQGRAVEGAIGMAAGLGVLAAAYIWAVSVGGEAVTERFAGILGDGLYRTFDQSRGLFIRYTFTELLFEFPFGAGLGRWGMMQVLFGDPTMWQAPPIHVEIQPTGWLLDGGIPLLLLSTGALLVALRSGYRLAVDATNGLQDVATILFCTQVSIAALCLTGPVFNTQLGIQFWAITGALYGVAGGRRA